MKYNRNTKFRIKLMNKKICELFLKFLIQFNKKFHRVFVFYNKIYLYKFIFNINFKINSK